MEEEEQLYQIQNELNSVLQKRMIAAETEQKRRKKLKTILILIALLIVSAFIVNGIMKEAYYNKLRNMATDDMDSHFNNVYADVISIEPEYFVYQYNTTKYGTKVGEGNLWDVVCKCETVEGKTIWVSFFYQYYPTGNHSKYEFSYQPCFYEHEKPLRLTGYVNTARQVADELVAEIGTVYVLDVRKENDS